MSDLKWLAIADGCTITHRNRVRSRVKIFYSYPAGRCMLEKVSIAPIILAINNAEFEVISMCRRNPETRSNRRALGVWKLCIKVN